VSEFACFLMIAVVVKHTNWILELKTLAEAVIACELGHSEAAPPGTHVWDMCSALRSSLGSRVAHTFSYRSVTLPAGIKPSPDPGR